MNRQPSLPGRSAAVGSARLRAVLLRTAATAGLLVATFGIATSASAHNVLISTNPADGSTVAALPSTVSLTFNLPALAIGSVMVVTGPSGNIAEGPPNLIDHNVNQTVRPGSPGGAYTVEWRVTSIDGHPISGEFHFTAKAGNGAGGGTSTGVAASPGASSSAAPVTGQQPSTAPSDSAGSSSSTPLIVLLVVVVVGVLAAGIYLVVRRPGPPPGENGPGADADSDPTADGASESDEPDPDEKPDPELPRHS